MIISESKDYRSAYNQYLKRGIPSIKLERYLDLCQSYDPTWDGDENQMGDYCDWLMLQIAKYGDVVSKESGDIKSMLSVYDELKNKKKLSNLNIDSNIQSYDINSLSKAMDSVDKTLIDPAYIRARKSNGSSEVVYDDGKWAIVRVFSFDDDKWYGGNSGWCTTADESYFKDYGGMYFIIIPVENGKLNLHSANRYQFHNSRGNWYCCRVGDSAVSLEVLDEELQDPDAMDFIKSLIERDNWSKHLLKRGEWKEKDVKEYINILNSNAYYCKIKELYGLTEELMSGDNPKCLIKFNGFTIVSFDSDGKYSTTLGNGGFYKNLLDKNQLVKLIDYNAVYSSLKCKMRSDAPKMSIDGVYGETRPFLYGNIRMNFENTYVYVNYSYKCDDAGSPTFTYGKFSFTDVDSFLSSIYENYAISEKRVSIVFDKLNLGDTSRVKTIGTYDAVELTDFNKETGMKLELSFALPDYIVRSFGYPLGEEPEPVLSSIFDLDGHNCYLYLGKRVFSLDELNQVLDFIRNNLRKFVSMLEEISEEYNLYDGKDSNRRFSLIYSACNEMFQISLYSYQFVLIYNGSIKIDDRLYHILESDEIIENTIKNIRYIFQKTDRTKKLTNYLLASGITCKYSDAYNSILIETLCDSRHQIMIMPEDIISEDDESIVSMFSNLKAVDRIFNSINYSIPVKYTKTQISEMDGSNKGLAYRVSLGDSHDVLTLKGDKIYGFPNDESEARVMSIEDVKELAQKYLMSSNMRSIAVFNKVAEALGVPVEQTLEGVYRLYYHGTTVFLSTLRYGLRLQPKIVIDSAFSIESSPNYENTVKFIQFYQYLKNSQNYYGKSEKISIDIHNMVGGQYLKIKSPQGVTFLLPLNDVAYWGETINDIIGKFESYLSTIDDFYKRIVCNESFKHKLNVFIDARQLNSGNTVPMTIGCLLYPQGKFSVKVVLSPLGYRRSYVRMKSFVTFKSFEEDIDPTDIDGLLYKINSFINNNDEMWEDD